MAKNVKEIHKRCYQWLCICRKNIIKFKNYLCHIMQGQQTCLTHGVQLDYGVTPGSYSGANHARKQCATLVTLVMSPMMEPPPSASCCVVQNFSPSMLLCKALGFFFKGRGGVCVLDEVATFFHINFFTYELDSLKLKMF